MDQAGLPARLEGDDGRADRGDPRDRASAASGRSSTASRSTPCAGPTGSARSSSRWASRTSGAGQIAISFGMTGPELRDGVGLRDRRPRDRRGVRDDPPRRRRHDDRGRHRGRHLRGRSSAGSPRCGRSRPGTTTRRRPRGRSTRAATASSSGEGAGVARPRGARARPGARRDDPRRAASATARPPTRRTSRCRRRAASARSARRAGRSRRPASTPDEIDHVNAHATSTPEGDKAELQAIRTIFGDHAPARSSITANKSMLGHTLGAAGRDRGDRHDPVDPRRLRPADDQPRRPRPRGRGPRPDAERRAQAQTIRVGAVELVRVRRPEHGPVFRRWDA